MSGFMPPRRSPWFGDSLTSATTQDSGLNCDTNRTICGTTHLWGRPGRYAILCEENVAAGLPAFVQESGQDTSSHSNLDWNFPVNWQSCCKLASPMTKGGPNRPKADPDRLIGEGLHPPTTQIQLVLYATKPLALAGRRHRRAFARCLTSRRRRLLVRLELGRILQLVLGHRDLELHALAIRGRLNLKRGRGECDILRADAEESTDADHIGKNLAVLVEQDVSDIADLLVVHANDIGALELGRKQLIGLLLGDNLALGGGRCGCGRRGWRLLLIGRLRHCRARQQRHRCRRHHESPEHVSISTRFKHWRKGTLR